MNASGRLPESAERVSVTVVIPCLDDAGFLEACLAALATQTRLPDRVIVVDNGSTDASVDVARAAGAEVLHEPRRGIWPATARGYDAAGSSGVIARLDADSIPSHDWLERIVLAFESDQGLDVLTGSGRFYGSTRLVHALGERLYLGGMYWSLTPWFGHPPIFGSNFAMRATVWGRVRAHVLLEDAEVHDDLDLSIRLPRGTRVVFDPDLGMEVSARPFASPRALATRLRKVAVTFQRSWPAGSAWAKRRSTAPRLSRRWRRSRVPRRSPGDLPRTLWAGSPWARGRLDN